MTSGFNSTQHAIHVDLAFPKCDQKMKHRTDVPIIIGVVKKFDAGTTAFRFFTKINNGSLTAALILPDLA